MNTVEIVESQKRDWNKVAPAWEKWDSDLDQNWSFINHLIVGYARVRPGLKVLDLGCGTGHPAFLAAAAVGRQGQVVGVDLAENMVQSANKKAKSLGFTQLAFEAGDVTHLKFETNTFDAVISRFCFMFVPEIEKALSETLRVVKPGAFFSAAVWSAADKNPYLKLPIDVLKGFIEIQAPGPNDPSLFRFAHPGLLAGIAQKAGFQVVDEQEVTGEAYKSSAEQYFTSLMEIAAPLQNLFAKLDPKQTEEAEAKIKQEAGSFRVNGKLALPFAVRVISCRKPA
ncbi:MAG: hypothetical protein A3A86_04560 [Elusimicrobia bacterium RIFCSPLOWO2_01_FULL_60_11]|nr:MAG: hypothetical protein A3A86_04560 [Elusimicrobia bacterium RIFCSPLOWO2_01_FULL_60_11]